MSKKVAITSLLTIMLLVGLVKLFPETIKETYAVSTTLADTVMTSATTDACNASGTGVCATNSYTADDSSTAYHDYRYRGADPNNYVKFNNDLYRIIGVFDDNSHGVTGKYLVKLIMADKLYAGSWGIYSTVDNIASGTYSSYKNDWTGSVTGVKANANILLNEYYYNKSNTSDTYGACSNWTYYYSGANYKTFSCSDIVGHGIDSGLQSYIEEVTWYLKGYTGNGYSKQNFYLCERGQSTDTTNCMSGNSGAYDASTTGKIGLMYASDYLYASSYFTDISTATGSSPYYGNKNWLYKGYEWTITPDADSSTAVFSVHYNGYVSANSSNFGYGARPSFYLKSNVYVTGGTGSIDDPYTIGDDGYSGGGTTSPADRTLTHLKNLGFQGAVSNTKLKTFTASSKLDGTTGIFSTEDDLGTSYYLRGNITNNYVKFGSYAEDLYMIYNEITGLYDSASTCTSDEPSNCTKLANANDDMYWRILRINGDGTIRLVYDGTQAYANNILTKNYIIGASNFNINSGDNAFLGYMNGTTDGTNFPNGGTNSISYEEAHTNRTDSSIKTSIDNWYKTNIVDNGYGDSVVDAIYCNDRTRITDEEFNSSYEMTGEGFGTHQTAYAVLERMNFNSEGMSEGFTPTLKCNQQNDRFTKNENLGNGDLTYPVGLLTADEIIFAGAYILDADADTFNDEFYLYGDSSYLVMTPYAYTSFSSIMAVMDSELVGDAVGFFSRGVRPVISISPDAIQYGTGTSTDPFRTTTD